MSRPPAAILFLPLLPLLAAAGLPHAQGTCGDDYRVVRGDTMYSIARLCGGTVAAIAQASGIADPARIEVGQRLDTDGAGPPRPAAGDGKDAGQAREPAGRGRDAAAGQARDEGAVYRMARGDTLYSLARWARVSLRALRAANPGMDPARIEIGDPIRLPAGARDPGPARARERGREVPTAPRPASARIEAPPGHQSRPRHEAPARDEPRREERRNAADEPDPDREPEAEGM